MRKGWFSIKGVQKGDRSLKQQIRGLDAALSSCPGKTVLDLGCAEGLIARSFAKRGAAAITGVEIVRENAEEARRQCAAWPITILNENVENYARRQFTAAADGELQFDCVLALAILHKLKNPSAVAEFIGMVTRDLAVVRLPPHTPGFVLDARSKMVRHDITGTLAQHGLVLERIELGPFDEWMGYYRRAA